jgi:hypothetical protein
VSDAPSTRPTRPQLALAAILALVFTAAPTPGDVGSCGQQATALDEPLFLADRQALDCTRCMQCGLTTQACQNACNPKAPSPYVWAATCYPLQHDGVVCLDALEAASCSTYASFVSDVDPTIPTECQFCLVVPEGGIVGDF